MNQSVSVLLFMNPLTVGDSPVYLLKASFPAVSVFSLYLSGITDPLTVIAYRVESYVSHEIPCDGPELVQ